MPKLDNWSVVYPETVSPYAAPESIPAILSGYVTNHPMLPNGLIYTSRIVKFNPDHTAQTKNTLYELGEPSAEFVKWLAGQGKSIDDYFKEV